MSVGPASTPDPATFSTVGETPAQIQLQREYANFARTLGYHVPQQMSELRRLGLAAQALVGSRRKR